ncbi:hypothetical protein Ahy_B09g096907 [Arachis hypogaea]|uniref:Retrotransposon gag domain-containing protein n=1 Tax=Arachis hypogaea TaxID=3818 RepID=A0A444XN52_ARAHY|nr:hypothetical protein Ahy_B09g096907 [Arachis hypogaea]
MIEYESDDDGISYVKKGFRLKTPAFKGRNNLEVYFEWERKVESFFATCILSEEKKVRLVQANFSDDARIWWTELGRSRRRYGKSPICSWEKMKKIMRRQFVPSSYHNEFFGRFCKLQQGSQSVMKYHKEFLYLMDKANIKRSPEVLMDRFLFGLRKELADTVQHYRYTTMDDLVKLAINWEQVQQMIDLHNKRNSSTPTFHSSSKPEMEEFVEYAVEGDVSLEDSTVQNFSTGSLGCFVDSLINYGGINMDEKKGRQIAHFEQDGETMVGKIELAHMKDIATIQWVEKSHQTMVFKPGDWVWIPWRDEEHLMQDSRTNLFEEGENDMWSGGHFRNLRAKGWNDNLVIFKDLNSRRIVPCQSWTSGRPRVRLKNSGAERARTHKAHWAKSGQQEAQ